jgi:hypothetical protein
MTDRLGWQRLVGAMVLVIGLSGCEHVGQVLAPAHDTTQEHQQAQAALARWAAAVEAAGGEQSFVPVGELTGQIGDWEQEVGDNNKSALMAGMVAAAEQLPAESPGEAAIHWDNGTTMSMQTISADQALQELRRAGTSDCPRCVPLQVTDARLSTATIQTSRGPASAPAWEFAVQGTRVTLTRIAVAARDGIIVTPPPWDANNSPTGMSIESATGTVGGKQLTVSFTGAPETADKPCGADYTAEAVESDTAVVVIVVPHENGIPGGCRSVGAPRTAVADLTGPLGERAVLEVKEGLPVPVLLTP